MTDEIKDEIKIDGNFSQAWKFTREHLLFLVAYLIIFFLVSSILQFAQDRIFNNILITAIIHIANGIIAVFLQMGFLKSALLITSGVRPGFEQLYNNGSHFISWVVAYFLLGLMVSIGLLFLSIPGLYILARFSLTGFFILDQNMGPIEALQASARASKGRCWSLFILFLCTLGLNILGCLLLGIGLFDNHSTFSPSLDIGL